MKKLETITTTEYKVTEVVCNGLVANHPFSTYLFIIKKLRNHHHPSNGWFALRL